MKCRGVKAGEVRHADDLAALLGEPYGTMILTLSVASIEIITTTGDPNVTLARDTMFSVVMIVLNGLVGLALLLGGMRYKEQEYNLRGVNAYLSVIVALSAFGLLVPNLTISTPEGTFSRGQEAFLIVMCIGLYAVFLVIQTTRHRAFFITAWRRIRRRVAPGTCIRFRPACARRCITRRCWWFISCW